MENIENVLNDLVAKLLTNGVASFSQDGLNIKTSYDNGCLSISASYESPVEDKTEKLVNEFESYVKSLNDEFFVEVAESFSNGDLKRIQDKVASKDINKVKEGIAEFMHNAKAIASQKVEMINKDIEDAKKELIELNEIRESYVHVLNKNF